MQKDSALTKLTKVVPLLRMTKKDEIGSRDPQTGPYTKQAASAFTGQLKSQQPFLDYMFLLLLLLLLIY